MGVVDAIRQEMQLMGPTTVQEAKEQIEARQMHLSVLDDLYLEKMDAYEKWDRLARTATSDALRASAKKQAEHYLNEANIVLAEITKREDELAFFQHELERLMAAATGTPTPTPTPTPKPTPTPGTTPPPPKPSPKGLPFGLTKGQALAAGGIAVAALLFWDDLFGGR